MMRNTRETGTGIATLHQAIVDTNLTEVKKLLAEQVDPNAMNQDGQTPLHVIIKMMIKAVANNQQEQIDNMNQIVNTLLEYKADINSFNQDGRTPLHLAIFTMGEQYEPGHLEIIKVLLKAHADPNRKTQHMHQGQGVVGQAPLHYAAGFGCDPLIAILKQHGANIDAFTDGPINDTPDRTPLAWAITCQHDTTVKALLDAGADPNLINNEGCAPLHFAAKCNAHTSIKTLVEHSAQLNLDQVDQHNQTPLHYAALGGHVDAVKALLGAGANPNIVDEQSQTPLNLLFEKNVPEKVERISQLLINDKLISLSKGLQESNIDPKSAFGKFAQLNQFFQDLKSIERHIASNQMLQPKIALDALDLYKKLYQLGKAWIDGDKDTIQSLQQELEHQSKIPCGPLPQANAFFKSSARTTAKQFNELFKRPYHNLKSIIDNSATLRHHP